jgi:surface antigen
MKRKRLIYLAVGLIIFGFSGVLLVKKFDLNPKFTIGQEIDNFNGVAVYYNGGVDNVMGRNTTPDGYNLGLKYQCVEFVKRYYYEHFNHKMPDSYGHAKDFFNKTLSDGQKNKQRNLVQYSNPSQTKPKVDDLLIFDGTILNKYGHVAIISNITEQGIEIIQQNPGSFGKSRETLSMENENGKWKINNDRVLGWLRKE